VVDGNLHAKEARWCKLKLAWDLGRSATITSAVVVKETDCYRAWFENQPIYATFFDHHSR
jgi:hypothetical protein